jgi:hypothetical protein
LITANALCASGRASSNSNDRTAIGFARINASAAVMIATRIYPICA